MWRGAKGMATMQPMHGSRVWQAVLEDLHGRTPRGSYETFLRSTEIAAFNADDARLTVAAPNTFVREQLEKRFHGPIVRSLRGILGYEVEVDFTVLGRPAANGAAPSNAASDSQGDDIPTIAPSPRNVVSFQQYQQPELAATPAHGLNPRYTFDHLIVSGFNRMAAAGAKQVADDPGRAYNPLFIYGGVGLGKTHILHAIGHEAMEQHPGCRVLYVSSETFTNEMINAIRENRNEEFRARYRTIDVLLIDDIQFIAGKESTQEEFFHTFNALHDSGKQIVISCDKPPKALNPLEDRLRSRFEWGLIADIQPPDLETRIAILRSKAEMQDLPVPQDVIQYLARRVPSNIRELEGSLNRIIAYASLNERQLSVDLAAAALDSLSGPRRAQLTPSSIITCVAKYFNLSMDDMTGKSRDKSIVVPRQIAMYLVREETSASLEQIGQLLGGRDHTTVMHGWDKISGAVQEDHQLRNDVLAIRSMLYGNE
jgi:chromosomal replication initiator protein